MDKIFLTDVSKAIIETQEIVREKLWLEFRQCDDFLTFEFYDWAFKNCLTRNFGAGVKNFLLHNYGFGNVYNAIEINVVSIFMSDADMTLLNSLIYGSQIQTVFNGKLLFILPCHVKLPQR